MALTGRRRILRSLRSPPRQGCRRKSEPRDLLATVLEHLGYGAGNATWRKCYLQGAHEKD
jgi:Alkyl sulfatase dimerisation